MCCASSRCGFILSFFLAKIKYNHKYMSSSFTVVLYSTCHTNSSSKLLCDLFIVCSGRVGPYCGIVQ